MTLIMLHNDKIHVNEAYAINSNLLYDTSFSFSDISAEISEDKKILTVLFQKTLNGILSTFFVNNLCYLV